MNRLTIVPNNEEEWLKLRTLDITSTEVAALFNVSPYMSPFELWHLKKSGAIGAFEETERMKWGTRLQDGIAAGIAEDQQWNVRRMSEYIRVPDLRIGASFDFEIEVPTVTTGGLNGVSTTGLLEVKNVDALQFRDGWIIDGDKLEAPLHIEFQVQHQLLVSGRAFAYIGALVGGNRVELIRREPNPKAFEQIKAKVAAFWKSIDDNVEPKPDYSRDADIIKAMHQAATKGKLFVADDDANVASLMEKYKEHAAVEKAAEAEKKSVQAQILVAVGDADKVAHRSLGSIDLGITEGGPVSYERKAFRRFTPHWKKEAK